MEIREHRELGIAVHIRAHHPNNGFHVYCDAGDGDHDREDAMPLAERRAALEHRIHREPQDHANHIRGATAGWVTGITRPVHVGRSTQVWAIELRNDAGELTCVSRLTLAVLQAR